MKKDEFQKKRRTLYKKILNKYPDLHFVLATGRTRLGTIPIREALGILNRPNTESILSNGCIIYDSNLKELQRNTLPIDYILKLHNTLKPYPKAIYFCTFEDGMITYDKEWAEKAREMVQENIIIGDKEEQIKKIESGDSKITKVTYVAAGLDIETIKKIKSQLEELGKEYNLETTNYSQLIVEYMPSNTNKGTSLNLLMKQLGISKDEVIAFGDGRNDIELLKNVGWPVVMENARDTLKPYGKIKAKSNVENGVADILEKIFLKEGVN